jgi:putative transposase
MERKYAYRRKLPHYQWANKSYFITFATHNRTVLTSGSRGLVLETCIRENGDKYVLHAVVVMPDHVHLMLTPRADEQGEVSLPEILQEIKSMSAQNQRVSRFQGTRVARGIVRSGHTRG